MENKKGNITPFGKYLKKIKASQSKIAKAMKIKSKRISLLSTEETAMPYADELYKIIYIANSHAGIPEENFNNSIDEIFPNRKKGKIIDSLENLSPDGKLFGKYTMPKQEVENHIGMPKGKISKYLGDKTKRALAIEVISFADGLNLDLLSTFKEIYGEITLKEDKKNAS